MPDDEHFDRDPLTRPAEPAEPVRFVTGNEKTAKPKSGFLWRWAKRLFAIGFVGILVACVAFWLARDWLKDKAVALVEEQLVERGIYLRFDKAEYSPLRGLVMNGVAICETPTKKVPLISVGNIGFKIGLKKLLTERSLGAFSAQINAEEADIALYHAGTPVFALDKLNLDAAASATAFSIDSAKGGYGDLALDLKGVFTFPPKSDKPSEKLALDFSALPKVTEWIDFAAEGLKNPSWSQSSTSLGGKISRPW